MLYVGLDVHKEFCQACVIDDSGRALSNERFSSTNEELDRFLDRFQDAKFVLESTGIWEFIYEGIERRGFEAVLAHPLKVRAIAEARVKTDKVDAETLAQLLRADLIPRSWIPSKDMRDLRQLVRQRAYLVRQAARFKNRIHAEILRRGVRRPENLRTPFAQRSIRWMRSLDIPTVTSCLNCLESVQAQVQEINAQLLVEFERRDDAQLISTVPGIGFYGALLILAEVDDVRRFHHPEKLCAYAGLVPTVSQSASSVKYGSISKDGSAYLRWILTESVHVHTRYEPGSQLSRFHARLAKRRGRRVATVATSRKLLRIIYWMLVRHEPFHSHGFNPVKRLHS
ncbi:MAG TPA: IS110 family transposase [Thermoplasmata archaeon]